MPMVVEVFHRFFLLQCFSLSHILLFSLSQRAFLIFSLSLSLLLSLYYLTIFMIRVCSVVISMRTFYCRIYCCCCFFFAMPNAELVWVSERENDCLTYTDRENERERKKNLLLLQENFSMPTGNSSNLWWKKNLFYFW